jgi:hypothetical protein
MKVLLTDRQTDEDISYHPHPALQKEINSLYQYYYYIVQ